MYLRHNMHLNLCQELKIYLPQAILTMLVMCWLIHCNFSFLFLCHVYSLLLSSPKHCYKSLSYSTLWLIKQNHSRFQLMFLYNLKWFLLSLVQPNAFCSRKKKPCSLQQTFSTLMQQVSKSLQPSCEADGRFCDNFSYI